jgi:hypothetical protein
MKIENGDNDGNRACPQFSVSAHSNEKRLADNRTFTVLFHFYYTKLFKPLDNIDDFR